MNFCYISPSTLPSRAANSVHVVWQCDALCEAGVKVTLYAKRSMPDAKKLKGELRNVYGIQQEALDLDTVYTSLGRADSLRIALHAVRRIRSMQASEIVILSRNLYAAFILAVVYRLPLMFETHQLEMGFRKWVQRLVMRSPRVLTIVISNHLEKYLTHHHGVKPRRTLVLHDAAPEGIVPIPVADRRSGLCETVVEARGPWRQVCGYFGHLYAGRGIEIVEAMASKRPECLFLVYGGTDADIADRRENVCLENIIFMGHVTHPVARDLMCKVDVLLMPYQESVSIGVEGHDTARWMSPMKMFEYLGAGVPIISSDLPVLREVLENRTNSILVSPGVSNEWIAALDLLWEDKRLADNLGRCAHDQYLRKHTWTRRAEAILEAVGEL